MYTNQTNIPEQYFNLLKYGPTPDMNIVSNGASSYIEGGSATFFFANGLSIHVKLKNKPEIFLFKNDEKTTITYHVEITDDFGKGWLQEAKKIYLSFFQPAGNSF